MIPETIDLDICLQIADWDQEFPAYREHIESCFDVILECLPEGRALLDFPHLELSILLSDDQNIHALNRQYRGKDKATNVLSFPSLSQDDIKNILATGAAGQPVVLGDVIFALETIKAEAHGQGKKFSDHFCHLCLHGILHLLGYDHVEEAEAEAMEALEKKLLGKLSIDDPYQD